MEKPKIYKWIKLLGFLMFIPMILLAGPLSGYIVGDFLVKKFKISGYATFIFIGVGFLASLVETVRIIRLAIKTEEREP